MSDGLHYRRGKTSRGKSNLGFSIGNNLQKQKKKKKVGVEGLKKDKLVLIFFLFSKKNSVRRHLYLHPVTTGKYTEFYI